MAGPVQLTPLSVNVGITVILAIIGEVPSLTPAKDEIFPTPKSPRPIAILSFDQVYVVVPPVFSVVNSTEVISALHIIWFCGSSTWAVGFTVIANISSGPSQLKPSLV